MQNGLEARLVFGEQAVGELDRRVRGSHFGRMNRAGDQHDRLALRDQLLGVCFRRDARIGQAPLDLAVAVEMAQRLRLGDGGGDERPAFDRLAQFLDANLIAGLLERAKIRDHLVPVEQFAVNADFVPEMTLRSRNRRLNAANRDERQTCGLSPDHARLNSVHNAR